MEHHTRPIGTNILLVKNDKVLLPRRQNTGWADGLLAIPGGHLEKEETARQAAVREIEEELGLKIAVERLQFYATAIVHTSKEYIYLEFFVELFDNEDPINAEPEKCSELVWCDPRKLPENISEVFRKIIEEAYVGGANYLEIGYPISTKD